MFRKPVFLAVACALATITLQPAVAQEEAGEKVTLWAHIVKVNWLRQ